VACRHEAAYGQTYADMQQRCYWDYWRVLTAGDSRLTASQVAPVPAERLLDQQAYDGQVSQAVAEGGTSEFSGLLVVPAGESGAINLAWQLPARVIRQEDHAWVYRLRIQKQPGLGRLPLQLSVTAPQGARLQAQDGWQESGKPGTWVWSGTVVEASQFELTFTTR
jgi:hypothetical protein